MKKIFTVMVLVSAFAVSGCATDNNWTPMSAGRTAGEATVVNSHMDSGMHKTSADEKFNSSLRK